MQYSNFHLKRAVEILNLAGIISYQSDTIAGLGALPIFEQCLRKIIQLKGRNENKGMILLGSEISQFTDFVDSTELMQLANHLKEKKPDHPSTFLIRSSQNLPDSIATLLKGNYPKLAIRITENLNIQAICQKTNLPIVSTSLNLANHHPLERNYQVHQIFPKLDYYLAIDKNELGSSQIIDFETGKVIRANSKN